VAKRGIQKRGLDLIFGTKEELKKSAETEEQAFEERREVVLFLRDNLNPADRNFTKYPNEIHSVMKDNLSEEAEGILYIYLWRQSWGFGKNYCRTSYLTISKDTVIGSKRTARRAMAGLIEKRFVIRALAGDREHDVTQAGALYRILTPNEIAQSLTDEAVPLNEIPEKGVVMMAMANMDMAKEDNNSARLRSMGNMAIAKMDIGHDDHSQDGQGGVVNVPMARMTTNSAEPQKIRNGGRYGQDDHSHNDHPLKDRKSLKDTLSLRDIVTGFYKSIGQNRIAREKRERAEKVIKELQADGFNLEDIQFAAEWTPENAKEELYDFSIIKHTIGQAMAAKEEAEAKKARRTEAERITSLEQEERDRQEQERAEIEAHKETLDPEARTALRERALKEIRSTDGIKEDFINDMLIAVKENEILKAGLGNAK